METAEVVTDQPVNSSQSSTIHQADADTSDPVRPDSTF